MRRSVFALPAVALIVFLAAAPVALAQGGGEPPNWYLNVTMNNVAKLINHGVLLRVSGTYQCATPDNGGVNIFDPYNSGLGANASEIIKNDVISGQGGVNGSDLNCDNAWHNWSADLQGYGSNGQTLWKVGKATANAGGQLCDTNNNCAGGGTPQMVLYIKH